VNLINYDTMAEFAAGYAPASASTASGTSFTPNGNLASTNVQGALQELDSEKQSNLGFAPVQQGTGIGQLNNLVKLGWSTANRLKLTVDNTDLGNIVTESQVIGIDQALQAAELTNTGETFTDGTSKYRAAGVTYTNTTGKPVMVIVSKNNTANTYWQFYINGVSVAFVNAYGTFNNIAIIVPSGATYMADTNDGVLQKWWELR
jgi:LysM repeat protein